MREMTRTSPETARYDVTNAYSSQNHRESRGTDVLLSSKMQDFEEYEELFDPTLIYPSCEELDNLREQGLLTFENGYIGSELTPSQEQFIQERREHALKTKPRFASFAKANGLVKETNSYEL